MLTQFQYTPLRGINKTQTHNLSENNTNIPRRNGSFYLSPEDMLRLSIPQYALSHANHIQIPCNTRGSHGDTTSEPRSPVKISWICLRIAVLCASSRGIFCPLNLCMICHLQFLHYIYFWSRGEVMNEQPRRTCIYFHIYIHMQKCELISASCRYSDFLL